MDFRITLAIGFVFLIIAGVAFYIPEFLHYEAEQPKEELGMAHSESIQVSKIDFNFITRTSPQILYVDYSVKLMNNGSLVIVIPYQGIVDEMPNNWQIKNFSSGSVVLFKNFTCTPISCVDNDFGSIKFNLTEKIDSWRFPNHYVVVPFSSTPSNDEILQFVNDLNKSTLPFSFGWNKVNESTLKITIDKEFDEWNTEPVSHLSSIENQDGGRNPILLWDISNDRPIFTVKYSSSKDNALLFYAQGIMGFGTGIGIGMIIDAVNTRRNEKQQKKLQDFIKIQRYMQDANTAYLLKKFEKAKNFYDLAIKIDEKNIDSKLLAGNSCFELKRYPEALSYYTKVLDIDPHHMGALNNSATCNDKIEDFEKGIKLFERALEVDKNHVDTLNNFGALILDIGLPDCALPFFNEVLRINRFDVVALTNQGKSLKAISKQLAMSNNPIGAENLVNEARRIFEEALKINSESVSTLTALGELYFELGYYDEAYACFNRSMKIEPLDVGSLYNMGIASLKLNKLQEAVLFFDEYLVLKPNDITALNDKGVTLARLNRDIEAIVVYNKILDIEPNNIDAIHNREISRKRLQLAFSSRKFRIF